MDINLKKTVSELIKVLPKPIADQVKTFSIQYLSKLEFSQVMFEPLDDIFKMKSLRHGINQVSKSASDDTRFLYSSILILINGIIAQLRSKVLPQNVSSKSDVVVQHIKKRAASDKVTPVKGKPKVQAIKPIIVDESITDDSTDGNVVVCSSNVTTNVTTSAVLDKPQKRKKPDSQDSTVILQSKLARNDSELCEIDRRPLITTSLIVSNFMLGRWSELPPSPLKCKLPMERCIMCNIAMLSSRVTKCEVTECRCNGYHVNCGNAKFLQKLHDRHKVTELVNSINLTEDDFKDSIPPILADTYFQALSMEFESEKIRRSYVLERTRANLQQIAGNARLIDVEDEKTGCDDSADAKSTRSRSTR